MSNENTCERCGGSKTVWFKAEAVKASEPVQPLHSPGFLKLCMCSPERPKPEEYTDNLTGVHLTVRREGEKIDMTLEWQEWGNNREVNEAISRLMHEAGLTYEM